jgi:hypothetical protein
LASCNKRATPCTEKGRVLSHPRREQWRFEDLVLTYLRSGLSGVQHGFRYSARKMQDSERLQMMVNQATGRRLSLKPLTAQ